MSKIRGDEDLLSFMDEMSSHQGYGSENNVVAPTQNAVTAGIRRIRLVPSVDGYPYSSRKAGSRMIWNPYIDSSPVVAATPIMTPCAFPPTNPTVEVFRRRAYEKFKSRFRTLFEIIVANQPPKPKSNDDASNLWNELSPPQIMERWQFGVKLFEMNLMRQLQQQQDTPTHTSATLIQTTGNIRFRLVMGREKGTLVDPILVASGRDSSNTHRYNNRKDNSDDDNKKVLSKQQHQTQETSAYVLKSELVFEWSRAWRRKVGGKTNEEALETYLASPKFKRKAQKLARDVGHLSTEVEGIFWGDLAKQSSREQHRTNHKHAIPKLSMSQFTDKNDEDEDDNNNGKHMIKNDDATVMTLTHLGLSFRIHQGHYKKLQILFDRFQSTSLNIRDHQDAFLSSVYSLLARYDMLQGAGLQSSLHGAVFDVLLKRFDCKMECFASPLNCRYDRFCSGFYDTDAPFGSVGSFFDYDFVRGGGGCYQANPPFAADFIESMHKTIDRALSDNNSNDKQQQVPLMFIVFVPAWTETVGWKALEGSTHLAKHLLLSQSSHYYCEGTQHRRKERYRVASFDSSVFFLQNNAAQQKWPVTEEAIQELRVAFKTNPEDEKDIPFITTHKNVCKDPKQSYVKESGRVRVQNHGQQMEAKVATAKPTKVIKDKQKRKLIIEESGGDKQQLSILSSLGIMDDKDESQGNSEKTVTFVSKKKSKRRKR